LAFLIILGSKLEAEITSADNHEAAAGLGASG